VIVENSGLFKSASEVADYLSHMSDTTVLVFVEKEIDKRNKLYKYVSKNGLAVEMSSMSDRDMKLWIATLLKENNCRMRESTAQYFLEQVENSMTNVKNELDKLIAYAYGREEITREDIDRVCSVQITGKIFQMMDAVATGSRSEAIRYYHDLLTLRESPMSILYLLSRHFHILLQIKSMQGRADKSEMAKMAGVPPFAVGKYQSQCRRFSEKKITQMLELCMDTEYQFKRGNLGDQMGVELLLVSFLNEGRA
jgi:DNA polymerase-3 subunit delta